MEDIGESCEECPEGNLVGDDEPVTEGPLNVWLSNSSHSVLTCPHPHRNNTDNESRV
jgi:hypothetical protein